MRILLLAILALGLSACGEQGDPGSQGVAGPAGQQGLTGTQGPVGTVVEVIQLCTGFVPTYPNVFPEVALRIAGKLYAVYSANGGFMVLLTPGTYVSNGINASCTFVVDSNNELVWWID